MKSCHSVLFLVPFLLCSCGLWHTGETTKKTDERAYSGIFLDGNSGVAVGRSGFVTATGNGGKQWIAGLNRSMCLYTSEAIDSATFIGAGNQGNVILTLDGGKSWGRKTDIDTRNGMICKSISFSGINQGWISTRGLLAETADACRTWTTVPLPAGVVLIEAVSFVGPGTGYLLGVDGKLFYTATGGQTWKQTGSPTALTNKSQTVSFGKKTQQVAIRFQKNKGVFACLAKTKHGMALLINTTADGGETWTRTESRALKQPPISMSLSSGLIAAVLNVDSTITTIPLDL